MLYYSYFNLYKIIRYKSRFFNPLYNNYEGKIKHILRVKNLDILYNIIKSDIFKKFKYDLDANSSYYKTSIFNSMSNIYSDNKEKSLKELNTTVLKTVIPDITNKVKNTLLKAKSNIRDDEVIDRTEDLKNNHLSICVLYPHQMIKILPMIGYSNEKCYTGRDSLNNKPNEDMNRFQSESDKAMDIKSIEKEMKKETPEININENPNDLNKISTPDMNRFFNQTLQI